MTITNQKAVIELAREKYGEHFGIKSVLHSLDIISMTLRNFGLLIGQTNPSNAVIYALDGVEGFSISNFGGDTSPSIEEKLHMETRAYTELYVVLINMLQELGEDVSE